MILDLVDVGTHYRGTVADGSVPVLAWTKGVEFAENAQLQIANIMRMPFVFHHVAVMPDVHYGLGSTVGSVVATKGAICPSAVGVDIGCGMMAYRTSLGADDLPSDLAPLRSAIEARVPVGRTDNGNKNDRGAWSTPPNLSVATFEAMEADLKAVLARNPGIANHGYDALRAQSTRHLGTLGTGNHFIEVCLDEERRVWIMLHSGSRGIGNRIATYFIGLAQKQAKKFFYDHALPDPDLAYLVEGTPVFSEYLQAVHWAQNYALANRTCMMTAILEAFAASRLDVGEITERVSCHHNYLSHEKHFGENVIVTRKGAVRAGVNDYGIIPGSMGAKSFIVRGRGNHDSFESCSHGAGRRLARNEAKQQITMEDFELAMAGVESRRDAEVLDEAPQAYKAIDDVLDAERDLVDIVHTIKQVIVVKG